MKRPKHPTLRLFLAFALLAGLFYFAEPAMVAAVLREADPLLLLWGTGAVFAMYFLRSLRWQTVLGIAAGRLETWPLFLWTLAGSLLNFLLPTSIGGDVGRWYLVQSRGVSRSAGALSLVLDRGLGTAAFIPLAAVTLLSGSKLPAAIDLRTPQLIPLILVCAAAAGVLVWLWRWSLSDTGRKRLTEICAKLFGTTNTATDELTTLHSRLRESSVTTWLLALLSSFLAHGCFILAEYWLARSVGASVTLWQMSLLYMLAAGAMIVPISPNGIGIREGLNLWFLTRLGNPAEAALAYSLLSLVLRFAACLPSLLFVDIRPRGK